MTLSYVLPWVFRKENEEKIHKRVEEGWFIHINVTYLNYLT